MFVLLQKIVGNFLRMSEEFDIFQNLEELRKTNLLDQLKALEAVKSDHLNCSQDLDDSFDFDSLVQNKKNVKKSPTKRHCHKEKTPEKKSKKNEISRRSSTSTNGSISPSMPLLKNLRGEVDNMPIARRTRRSVEALKNATATLLENGEASTSKSRGKGKRGGRGRGQARGRARGRGQTSTVLSDILPNSSNVSEYDEGASASSDHSCSTLTIMDRFLQQGCRGRSRVMRARRQYLAEIAARSKQIDSIDLVSSPMPRVEGFIDLDSDTEEATRITPSKKQNKGVLSIYSEKNDVPLDISYDEDNPELNIKVNWKGKLEAFKLRKYQKFSTIFKQLAEREDISIENIVFNLNDRIIMDNDTPDSINYKIFHFIDGRVLSNRFNSPGSVATAGKKRDSNIIALKIQSDKWKKPLPINIMKTDKFRILYIKCAEELKVDINQLKLSFDGELLEANDTPADLELDGGEAIDLRIK